MSDYVYQDEVRTLLDGGGYFETRDVGGRVVGLYNPDRKHFVNIMKREADEAYHPDMKVCVGTFPGLNGPVAYHSYAEYIEKIEAEFQRAMARKMGRQ